MDDFWKNKKIIAYIALAHHARFITPVMEELVSQGAQIRYIVGQAERSQEVTAIELGLDYSHIYDFISDEDHEDIRQNYHLLRQTFVVSLKNDCMLGMQPLTVTDKILYGTAAEYIGFRNLLKLEKPDLCFALHELNRWGKMFGFWAKKENIPFITLQEGLYYGRDFAYSGHAQYSTLNLVWGEGVKKQMIAFEAPESKIVPVGNTHLSNEIAFQKKNRIRQKKREAYGISGNFVTLLILHPSLPNPALFTPIFKTVSKMNRQTLFVKFHPITNKLQIDQWKKFITAQFKKNIYFIHDQENAYDLLSMADVCVLGQRSTTGLEAIAFGKPLVKLDFAYKPKAPYSFVDQGVAVKMSVVQLADALADKTDFSKLLDSEKQEHYLKQELANITGVIENVCRISKKIIQANTPPPCTPIDNPDQPPGKKWSIIIQVPDNPYVFLAQLEAVALNSENQGDYEIILLESEKKSNPIIQILDSLEGDLKRIIIPEDKRPITMINKAAETARGEYLIFFEKNLAPPEGWLDCLNKAFSKYGSHKVFGARISDKDGKIATAGMVVDHNNTPVCTYRNLNMDFPGALKERSFQMVDSFVAMNRTLFFKTGGFSPDAGRYAFLDICLKILQATNDPDAVIYLPGLKLIFLDHTPQRNTMDDAIYFYGKWHGCLWESEKQLHLQDGVSQEELTQIKMTAAFQAVR